MSFGHSLRVDYLGKHEDISWIDVFDHFGANKDVLILHS